MSSFPRAASKSFCQFLTGKCRTPLVPLLPLDKRRSTFFLSSSRFSIFPVSLSLWAMYSLNFQVRTISEPPCSVENSNGLRLLNLTSVSFFGKCLYSWSVISNLILLSSIKAIIAVTSWLVSFSFAAKWTLRHSLSNFLLLTWANEERRHTLAMWSCEGLSAPCSPGIKFKTSLCTWMSIYLRMGDVKCVYRCLLREKWIMFSSGWSLSQTYWAFCWIRWNCDFTTANCV